MKGDEIIKDEIIKINGVDLHVIDYGGCGEAIICVYGLTANCRFWDSIAERLTEDYRVIAFYLRGRGDSQKSANGYHIERHAQDVKGILDYYNIEKTIFMGHSLGAMIGCCFAAKYTTSISHLILIDGGADIDPMVAELLSPTIGRLGKV